MSRFYSSTEWDSAASAPQLTAHSVLCPGCSPVEANERELLLQKALYLSQFLRLFMIIDGVFLVLWAILAWPFFLGLLLIIMGFYGVKYYNTALSCMYGVYLVANAALRVYWLTHAHDAFDIVILALGLAVVAYIFSLLCTFVWTVSMLRDDERALLAAYSNWDFGYYTPVIIMPVVIAGDAAGREGLGFFAPPHSRTAQPSGRGAADADVGGTAKEGQPPATAASYQGGTPAGGVLPPKGHKAAAPSGPRHDPNFVV